MAKIADQIVRGKAKGNIIGWYHSHTEGGVFFSETDIQTQTQLQQFSGLVIGMVVDSNTDEVGFFRVDPKTGQPFRLPADRIMVLEEGEEPAAPRFEEQTTRPTAVIEVRPKPEAPRPIPKKLITAVTLIVIIGSAAILGTILYRGGSITAEVNIIHSPIRNATIGTPLPVVANVTGAPKNVTLYYAIAGNSFTPAPMTSPATGQYQYTIPGDRIKGSFTYYIQAFDEAGKETKTPTYAVQLADFLIIARTSQLTVYPTKSKTVELSVVPINGFNQQVSFSTIETQQGVSISFSPNPLPAGTTVTSMNVTANQGAQNATYTITVTGSYLPPDAPAVTRQTPITVTIADFNLQIAPTSRQVAAASTTTFTVTLTIQNGFADPVKLTVAGLPPGATYQIVAADSQPLVSGPGTHILTLQISTQFATKSGTYALTVTAAGGGIAHSQTVQLIVR